MKPLVTKKYIFERMLASKPIVVDMFDQTDRLRYNATRELFRECGVFKPAKLNENGEFDHGRDTELTHEVHCIVPKFGDPYVHVLLPTTFASDAYGANNTHFLP